LNAAISCVNGFASVPAPNTIRVFPAFPFPELPAPALVLDFDDEPQPATVNATHETATASQQKRARRTAILFLSVMIQIGTKA
jgi:hypothetical protein